MRVRAIQGLLSDNEFFIIIPESRVARDFETVEPQAFSVREVIGMER